MASFKINSNLFGDVDFMFHYLCVISIFTAVKADYNLSTLIILTFSLTFIFYVIINLPFNNILQNYRCILIHITILFTLLTTNYDRTMKGTSPL
jgi:hypothetical protein